MNFHSMKNQACIILLGRGIALGGLGKYNDAITYYDDSIAINPMLLGSMKAKEFTLAYINNTIRQVKT
jgi:hypothetical protein